MSTSVPIQTQSRDKGSGCRPRVLLVSSSSGSQGGGELYLEGLAEGLTAIGHPVACLLAAHPRMDGLSVRLARFGQVHRADFPNTYDRRTRAVGSVLGLRTIARLAKLFAALRPDVIHLNKQNLEDGLDLLLAAERTRLPAVCTVHVTRGMTTLGSAFGRVRDWIARGTLNQFKGEYIAIADTCQRQFIQFAGSSINGSRIHSVPNGVRSVPSGDRAGVRREWGVVPGDVVLGCVARIEEQKNPLFALDVLAQLPANVHLAWVGDGRLRGPFEQRLRELGLTGRVHLDGWRSDARQRMAGFDVFILPSLYEGFPFAVLEAMAAGLPCVVSDVDGTREAVDNGVTGWLCQAQVQEEWLAKLNELIADPVGRAKMGEAGRRRVEECFSLESMARGTAAVYEVAIRRAACSAAGTR